MKARARIDCIDNLSHIQQAWNTKLYVINAKVFTVACDDILGIDVTREWRIRIFVVVQDEPVRCVLAVNHGVLPVTVLSLEFNLLTVMAEATVTDTGVNSWEKDDLVVLIASVDTLLNGIVWPGDGAVTNSVGSSWRDVHLREEKLERVETEVCRLSRRSGRLHPLWSEELWSNSTVIIGDHKVNTLAKRWIGAVSC